MTDVFDQQKRSWIMSRVKGRDTKPEVAVRSALHRAGFRFRLHAKDLPGAPDIVLRKHRMVVFVNGCFWHGHGCPRGARIPAANRDYWVRKIARNQARDRRVQRQLRRLGWRVRVVWECKLERGIERVLRDLAGGDAD